MEVEVEVRKRQRVSESNIRGRRRGVICGSELTSPQQIS